MVRVGGDTSDGVGFCIFFLSVFLSSFDRLDGGVQCMLARSPFEVCMLIPSISCGSVWSDGGFGSVGIIPGVFYLVTC